MSHLLSLFAPEGRLTVAQGVSPGKPTPHESPPSPGGAEDLKTVVFSRPSGAPVAVWSCSGPTAGAVGYLLTPLRGFISDKVSYLYCACQAQGYTSPSLAAPSCEISTATRLKLGCVKATSAQMTRIDWDNASRRAVVSGSARRRPVTL